MVGGATGKHADRMETQKHCLHHLCGFAVLRALVFLCPCEQSMCSLFSIPGKRMLSETSFFVLAWSSRCSRILLLFNQRDKSLHSCDSSTSRGEFCSGGQRKHGEHTLCPRLAFMGAGAQSQAAFPPQFTKHGHCGGPTRLCSRSTCRPTHTRDRALLHNYPRKFRNCTWTHSAPCTV